MAKQSLVELRAELKKIIPQESKLNQLLALLEDCKEAHRISQTIRLKTTRGDANRQIDGIVKHLQAVTSILDGMEPKLKPLLDEHYHLAEGNKDGDYLNNLPFLINGNILETSGFELMVGQLTNAAKSYTADLKPPAKSPDNTYKAALLKLAEGFAELYPDNKPSSDITTLFYSIAHFLVVRLLGHTGDDITRHIKNALPVRIN